MLFEVCFEFYIGADSPCHLRVQSPPKHLLALSLAAWLKGKVFVFTADGK